MTKHLSVLVVALSLIGCNQDKDTPTPPVLSTEITSFNTRAPASLDNSDRFERSYADSEDLSSDDFLVHVIYALPKGNKDKYRDISGQIQDSVYAANDWFENISNGKKFKLDQKASGDLDVTFWDMPDDNLSYLNVKHPIHKINADLRKTNWYNPNKLYVVYFEGAHPTTCGDSPGGIGNHAVGIYLYNAVRDSRYRCADITFSSDQPVKYVETIFVHEVIHKLGVPHTYDSVDDVMNGTNEAKTGPHGLATYVDWNNDDYYLHGDPNKLDINKSRYLMPSDGVEEPPYWGQN